MTQPSEQKNIMTRPFTGVIHFKVTKGIQLKSGITMGSHANKVLSTKVGQNTIESIHTHSKGSKFACK